MLVRVQSTVAQARVLAFSTYSAGGAIRSLAAVGNIATLPLRALPRSANRPRRHENVPAAAIGHLATVPGVAVLSLCAARAEAHLGQISGNLQNEVRAAIARQAPRLGASLALRALQPSAAFRVHLMT